MATLESTLVPTGFPVKDYGASLHINRSYRSCYIYATDSDDKHDFRGFQGIQQALSHAMLFGKDRVVSWSVGTRIDGNDLRSDIRPTPCYLTS